MRTSRTGHQITFSSICGWILQNFGSVTLGTSPEYDEVTIWVLFWCIVAQRMEWSHSDER